MKFSVKHILPHRIRFTLSGKIPETEAYALEDLMLAQPGVERCTVYPKAGALAVSFTADSAEGLAQVSNRLCSFLKGLTRKQIREYQPLDSTRYRFNSHQLFTALANMTLRFLMRRAFVPPVLKAPLTLLRALPFWKRALDSLEHSRLDVPVLDAAAIAMGILQGKPASSGSIMYLLRVGETLENYAEQQSKRSLIQSLLALPDQARVVADDTECDKAISELNAEDMVVVRTGSQIPVDATIIQGSAAINQASLTGESLAVYKCEGDTVYAGTVVEDGEIFIRLLGEANDSKMRSIVTMVEQSADLKSERQNRVEQMADRLVPWNFLLAALVALTTRSITKTSAALMVDYSCALRLSGSLAVLAAQRESAARGFVVKGSKYFSRMAQADVIVFDKTGTLTQATPCVAEVVPYNGCTRKEVLRLAACLEEHFPHPVAQAVVAQAAAEGLEHRERHAQVEYVVAHGIASSLEGKRVVIGSEHFVLEDEHVELSEQELQSIHDKAQGKSPLFLAVDGVLRGIIYIEDPLKQGAAGVLDELRSLGFKRTIMLTGDHERAAARIAAEAGVDEYHANLLPEEKYRIVKALQAEGHNVVMVGDGVNDSPALAAASISIAMGQGSAVARETADVALVSDDLQALVDLRRLSVVLEKRLTQGYRSSVAVNSVLLALGIGGVISPQVSSVIHNASTVVLAARSSRTFLPSDTLSG